MAIMSFLPSFLPSSLSPLSLFSSFSLFSFLHSFLPLFFFLKTRSHCVVQAGLEFTEFCLLLLLSAGVKGHTNMPLALSKISHEVLFLQGRDEGLGLGLKTYNC